MIQNFFVCGDWVSNHAFAALAQRVHVNHGPLANLVERVKEAPMSNIRVGDTVEYGEVTCYEFQGYSVNVRCQKAYIDLITSGFNKDYYFKYAPESKVVCIFDKDGLIGFVMRLKNEGEE